MATTNDIHTTTYAAASIAAAVAWSRGFGGPLMTNPAALAARCRR